MSDDKLIQFKGTIYENGYGLIAKKVMKDPELSIEAKSIYSYLCAYAGNNQESFPGEALIKHELSIGRNRFYKYLKELIDSGYVTKSKNRDSRGQYKSNLYSIEAVPCIQNRDTVNQYMDKRDMENEDTTNNNITNNNITNNNYINNKSLSSSSKELTNRDVYKHYEKCGFGTLNITITEMIDADIQIYGHQLVIDAMSEAVRQNRYKLAYAEGILRNWKANGRDSKKKEVRSSGINRKTNKQNGSAGPSEESRRLEEYARQQGINIDTIEDIECDF